jgi:orotidine-5'-phosphate decarboxylase
MAGENASPRQNPDQSTAIKKISAYMSILSPAVRLTDGGEEMNARMIVAITSSASNKGRMINRHFRLNQ